MNTCTCGINPTDEHFNDISQHDKECVLAQIFRLEKRLEQLESYVKQTPSMEAFRVKDAEIDRLTKLAAKRIAALENAGNTMWSHFLPTCDDSVENSNALNAWALVYSRISQD